jgi:hypothetical protein
MAEVAGNLAARSHFIVVTGGLSGVMRAAARGARQAEGGTLGILPGTELRDANESIDIVVPTGIGLARNVVTALAGDIMVALPGGLGTLQEMTYALEYKRPVCSWGSWTREQLGGHELVTEVNNEAALAVWLGEQRARLEGRDG